MKLFLFLCFSNVELELDSEGDGGEVIEVDGVASLLKLQLGGRGDIEGLVPFILPDEGEV